MSGSSMGVKFFYSHVPLEHILARGGRKRCTHKRKAGGRIYMTI